MASDAFRAAIVASLKESASELHARPPEEMNSDWADVMAQSLLDMGVREPNQAPMGGGWPVNWREQIRANYQRGFAGGPEAIIELLEKHWGVTISGDPVPEDKFLTDLTHLIHMHHKETSSNTHDFILAQYLQQCLDAFNYAVRYRSSVRDDGEFAPPIHRDR